MISTKTVVNNQRTVSSTIDMSSKVKVGDKVYLLGDDVATAEQGKFSADAHLIDEHHCVSLNEDGSEPFFIPAEDLT